eukprot:4460104-Prymnesium_polylepis.1
MLASPAAAAALAAAFVRSLLIASSAWICFMSSSPMLLSGARGEGSGCVRVARVGAVARGRASRV